MENIGLWITFLIIAFILIAFPLVYNYESIMCDGEYVKTRLYPPQYRCEEHQK